jgi:hypothetical protein
MEKEELIKKIMNCCFADDAVIYDNKFWDNFGKMDIDKWKEIFRKIYFDKRYYDKEALPDPDATSKKLYEAHEFLCKLQGFKVSISEDNDYELVIDGKNIRLSSDSIMSIYWHWSGKRYPYKNMQEIIEKISSELQKKSEYNKRNIPFKEFIKSYLQKANTIGGFVVFPKHYLPTVNTERGRSGKIRDRFDLTLECIRRAYQYGDFYCEDDNPLFGLPEEDKEFFRMFGSFENYAKFFCLNESYDSKHNWVTEDCSAVYDLMSENGEKTLLKEGWPEKILPCDYTSEEEKVAKWWTFYRNIMKRLDVRNQQIAKLLRERCSDDDLQKLYNSLDLS